jgi:hypothetical protein
MGSPYSMQHWRAKGHNTFLEALIECQVIQFFLSSDMPFSYLIFSIKPVLWNFSIDAVLQQFKTGIFLVVYFTTNALQKITYKNP